MKNLLLVLLLLLPCVGKAQKITVINSTTGVGKAVVVSGGASIATSGVVTLSLPASGGTFGVYAAGTVYTMTASSAALTFGTTSPATTITTAGTYLILARVTVKYNAATYIAAQTASFKVRRTNNTAADVANSSASVTLPVLTTFTGGDSISLPPVIYTTAATTDALSVFGGLSATPSAGSVTAEEANILAIRLY